MSCDGKQRITVLKQCFRRGPICAFSDLCSRFCCQASWRQGLCDQSLGRHLIYLYSSGSYMAPGRYQHDKQRNLIWWEGFTCIFLFLNIWEMPNKTDMKHVYSFFTLKTTMVSEQTSSTFKNAYREELKTNSKWSTNWNGFSFNMQICSKKGFIVPNAEEMYTIHTAF